MNTKKISWLLLVLPVFSWAQNNKPFTTAGKKVEVYTTAENTAKRLSPGDPSSFTSKPQPFENEISVFVDPTRKFQTYMGIGGALTDAAAETFYKMPKDKQKELLKAYFDKKEGIGYTIGEPTSIAATSAVICTRMSRMVMWR